MIVIKTKYLPATNTKGSRIKAVANDLSVTVPYNYSLSGSYVHFEAVKELVKKHNLEWDLSKMGYGSDNNGYYFTFNNSIMGA